MIGVGRVHGNFCNAPAGRNRASMNGQRTASGKKSLGSDINLVVLDWSGTDRTPVIAGNATGRLEGSGLALVARLKPSIQESARWNFVGRQKPAFLVPFLPLVGGAVRDDFRENGRLKRSAFQGTCK